VSDASGPWVLPCLNLHRPYILLCLTKDNALRTLTVLMLSGEIMVSAMGDAEGKGRGGYVLLDQNFQARCPCLRISIGSPVG